MTRFWITLLLFLPTYSPAQDSVTLRNHLRFFKQVASPEYSLPVPLTEKVDLEISLQIPAGSSSPTLKKLAAQTFESKELSAKLEIYYFNQNSERYLSQQVFIYRNSQLISKCTSYFSLEQGFLVPGACSGREGDSMWGLSIFKGLVSR